MKRFLRLPFIAFASVAAACTQVAAGEPHIVAAEKAGACIDAGLEDVERAFDSLSEATDFLVFQLCRLEVDEMEEAYRTENLRLAEIAKIEKCGELKEGDSVFDILAQPIDLEAMTAADNQRSEILRCHREHMNFGGLQLGFVDEALPAASDELTAYTARRLLELRTSRLESASTGDN